MQNTMMIKPFTILSTRSEDYGTVVKFSVSVRIISTEPGYKGKHTLSTTAIVLVPLDEDVDNFLFDYLVKNNWIKQ